MPFLESRYISVHLFRTAKPITTKVGPSVTVTCGDTLEIECLGWGWPIPVTTWKRQTLLLNEYVPEVELFDVTSVTGRTYPRAGLRIKRVNSSEQSEYMCLMSNELGVANTTIYVRVKGILMGQL